MIQPGDTGEGVFQVGMGFDPVDPSDNPDRQTARALINEAATELARFNMMTRQAAEACLRSCASTLDECTDCIRGQIYRILEGVDAELLKIDRKIRKPAEKALEDVLIYGAQLGLPYPSEEDILLSAAGLPPSPLIYDPPADSPEEDQTPIFPPDASIEEMAILAGQHYRRHPVHYAPSVFRKAQQKEQGLKFLPPVDLTPRPSDNASSVQRPAGNASTNKSANPPALPPPTGADPRVQVNYLPTGTPHPGAPAAGQGGSASSVKQPGRNNPPITPRITPPGPTGGGGGAGGGVIPPVVITPPGGWSPTIPFGPPGGPLGPVTPDPFTPGGGTTGGGSSGALCPPGSRFLGETPGVGITCEDGNGTRCIYGFDGSRTCVPCDVTYGAENCPPGGGGGGGGETIGGGGGETIGGGDAGGDFDTPKDCPCPPVTVNVYPSCFPIAPPGGGDAGGDFGDDTACLDADGNDTCTEDTGDDGQGGTQVGGTGYSVFQFNSFCDPEDYDSFTGSTVTVDEISQTFKQAASDAAEFAKAKATELAGGGVQGGVIGIAVGTLVGAVFTTMSAAVTAAMSLMPMPNQCDIVIFTPASLKWAFLGFIQRWLGIVPPPTTNAVAQELNLACQTGTPTTAELCGMRLRGFVDYPTWLYGVKLNGDCPAWFESVTDAMQANLSPTEIVAANRAEMLVGPDYTAAWKRAGVTDPFLPPIFEKISEFLPGGSDLVSLMTRDVFDDSVVAKYKYAEDFDKKFDGVAKEWAKRQGIPVEVMRRYWYRHWQLPSNTAAYEMVHRLAPGMGGQTPDGKPVTVTPDDVRELLKINDLAPGWVDQIMALTFRVLTRVDVRRLYDFGIITKAEVVIEYRKQGYTQKDAQRMADWMELNSKSSRAKRAGLPTENTIRTLYIQDGINDTTATAMLADLGHDIDAVNSRLLAWRREKYAKDKIGLINRIKSKYLAGGLDDVELISALNQLDLSPNRATTLSDNLSRRKQLAPREVTAQTLCTYVKQGLLSFEEYKKRMANLGFSKRDAALGASSCATTLAEKLAKDLSAQVAKLAREGAAAEKRRKDKLKARVRRRIEELAFKDPPKPFGDGQFVVEDTLRNEGLPPSVAAIDAN